MHYRNLIKKYTCNWILNTNYKISVFSTRYTQILKKEKYVYLNKNISYKKIITQLKHSSHDNKGFVLALAKISQELFCRLFTAYAKLERLHILPTH